MALTFVAILFFSSVIFGQELPTSNPTKSDLWDILIDNCDREPTIQCVQKTALRYLNSSLDLEKDYDFGIVKLQKNNVTFNETYDSEITLQQVQNKAIKFFITHDVLLQLPNTTEASSRSLQLSPKVTQFAATPRIFFKKIQKYISSKLLNAGLAILLVLALIKVKLMFFVPMILGMATAKKLLLKLLLFVFPFLAHIFKLCPYYASAEGTKFHHHDHSIKHVHVLPTVVKHHPHHYHHHPHEVEYYKDKHPGYIKEVLWDREGDKHETNGWMNGYTNPPKYSKKPGKGRPLTPFEIQALAIRAEKEEMIKHRLKLQQEQQRIDNEKKFLQDKLKQAIQLQEKLKLEAINTLNRRMESEMKPPLQSQSNSPVTIPKVTQLITTTPKTSTTKRNPFYEAVQKAAIITYDPFYSPILEKIDEILIKIGFKDESCKEKLICSMYKNPEKFSPYSNLVSAQLSRDANELQKPTTTNAAVVRFYRYVQAARDGQDKRECLRLYPACAINTEV